MLLECNTGLQSFPSFLSSFPPRPCCMVRMCEACMACGQEWRRQNFILWMKKIIVSIPISVVNTISIWWEPLCKYGRARPIWEHMNHIGQNIIPWDPKVRKGFYQSQFHNDLPGPIKPAPTSTSSSGCQFLLGCGWTSTVLILYLSPLLIWMTRVEPAEGWPPAPQLGNIAYKRYLEQKRHQNQLHY